jgi:predicted short-subunit dehydrogenase-like oxidoreductase (DUF2520 family)
MTRKFAIVGAGTVGSALSRLLVQAGYEFIGAASRSPKSAAAACRFAGAGRPTTNPSEVTLEADLVFLTTADDIIRRVCGDLASAGGFRDRAVVAHCSGALPSTILENARQRGASIGSMHPLQTFATAEQAVEMLPGSYCCIEGDSEAVKILADAARAMRMKVLTIPTHAKPLYHAAAAVASNYLVVLENAALKLGEAAGISRTDALNAFLPLIKGTVANLEQTGIPQSLTGPIARGDVQTVRRHLEAIAAGAPGLVALYKALGREAVDIAIAKGTLGAGQAEELLAILQ